MNFVWMRVTLMTLGHLTQGHLANTSKWPSEHEI